MMSYRTARTVVTLTVAVLLAVSAVSTAGALQEGGTETAESNDGPTMIDSCTTITEPGVYELGGNLTNATADTTIFEIDGENVTACIVVQSDDVVLEGNGYAVEGATNADDANVSLANQTTNGSLANVTTDNETDYFANETLDVGVAVLPSSDSEDDLQNVTVRNVQTREWFAGMFFENTTESTVENVESTDNVEIGIELSNVTSSTIDGVRADDNGGIGVIMFDSDDNDLSAVQSVNNRFVGFVIGESDRNRLTDVRAVNQSIAGMAFFDSGSNLVSGVEVRETAGEVVTETGGLLFDNASDNLVTDVAASQNRNWTYYATNGSVNNTVLNLTDDGRTVSFIATDVAVRFDENATDADGSPLVVFDTNENASILVDVRWTEATPDTLPADEIPTNTTDPENESESAG